MTYEYQPKKIEKITECESRCQGKLLTLISVQVENEEYQMCEDYSHVCWSTKKKGSDWNKGLINNEADPRRTERTGKLGEMAFGKVFGIPVDCSYRERGDEQDFILQDHKVNLKTASRNYYYGLVKAKEYGKVLEIKHDLFAFAFVKYDDRAAKSAEIILVGVELASKTSQREMQPARLGRHLNYEVPFSECITMIEVLRRYSRRESII